MRSRRVISYFGLEGLDAADTAVLAIVGGVLAAYIVIGSLAMGVALAIGVLILSGWAVIRHSGSLPHAAVGALPLLVIALLPATGLGGSRPYDRASIWLALILGGPLSVALQLLRAHRSSGT